MTKSKVVCYAGGIIGSSWATGFALNGCNIYVYGRRDDSIDKAKTQIEKNIDDLIRNNCVSEDDKAGIIGRLKYTTDVEEALKGARFVQENGPEDLNKKQEIVEILDKYTPAYCVVASSTSGLRITDIVKNSVHPERYIGAHPFNPPHLIPLVEITKGEKTDEKYIDVAVDFYKSVKKEPVVLLKEKKGFVANRLSYAVLREVMNLVSEGVCSVEDIDKALVYGPGLRWASIGQLMVGELGTTGGTAASVDRFGPLNEMIYRDFENRVSLPENWKEIAVRGIEEEKKNLPDFIGHTNEEIIAFRDKVLIEVLKLHQKI